jgi:hypothetical protein
MSRGVRLRCPSCKTIFRSDEAEGEPARRRGVTKPRPPVEVDDVEQAPSPRRNIAKTTRNPSASIRGRSRKEEYEDESASPRGKRGGAARGGGSNRGMVIGVVIGLLVLAGGGVAASLVLSNDKKPEGSSSPVARKDDTPRKDDRKREQGNDPWCARRFHFQFGRSSTHRFPDRLANE